jgi:hypothetical protein
VTVLALFWTKVSAADQPPKFPVMELAVTKMIRNGVFVGRQLGSACATPVTVPSADRSAFIRILQ